MPKPTFKPYLQHQLMLLPPDISDLVPADSVARVVDSVVEALDRERLERLYPGGREPEHSRTHSQVVSACAAVQAAEAERLLSGEKPRLWGRLLMADLDSMSVHTVSFCTL